MTDEARYAVYAEVLRLQKEVDILRAALTQWVKLFDGMIVEGTEGAKIMRDSAMALHMTVTYGKAKE